MFAFHNEWIFEATASQITRDLQLQVYDTVTNTINLKSDEKLADPEADSGAVKSRSALFSGISISGAPDLPTSLKILALRLGLRRATQDPAQMLAWHYLELAAQEEQITMGTSTPGAAGDRGIFTLSQRTGTLLEAVMLNDREAEQRLWNLLCTSLLLPNAVTVPEGRVAWDRDGARCIVAALPPPGPDEIPAVATSDEHAGGGTPPGEAKPKVGKHMIPVPDITSENGVTTRRHALMQDAGLAEFSTVISSAVRTWEVLRAGAVPEHWWNGSVRKIAAHHRDGPGGPGVDTELNLEGLLQFVQAFVDEPSPASWLLQVIFPKQNPLWDPEGLVCKDGNPVAPIPFGCRLYFTGDEQKQDQRARKELEEKLAKGLPSGVPESDEDKSTAAPSLTSKDAAGAVANTYRERVLDPLLQQMQERDEIFKTLTPAGDNVKALLKNTIEVLKGAVKSSNDDAKNFVDVRMKLGIFQKVEATSSDSADKLTRELQESSEEAVK